MDKVKVRLASVTPNYKELLMLACSKPYGNDVTMKGVQRIVDSGHLSVLEHCSASFEVECSVRVLGQLTRHRHLSFTVKSARGSEYDEMVLPQAIDEYGMEKGRQAYPNESEETIKILVDDDKKTAIRHSMELYGLSIEDGVPYQDAAYFLPQGVLTSMVVTGNLRAWYEYLPKRLCKRAMPEHRKLAEMIHEELRKAVPEIFDRDFMPCEHCKEHSCEFH
jgi:thymidylate synthase (FAD)